MPPPRNNAATSSISAPAGAAPIRHCRMRPLSRPFQQLSRVRNRRRRDLFAAEHAGDLADARLVVLELPDACPGLSAAVLFPDVEMGGAEAGDLRQMRDADDLIARREIL